MRWFSFSSIQSSQSQHCSDWSIWFCSPEWLLCQPVGRVWLLWYFYQFLFAHVLSHGATHFSHYGAFQAGYWPVVGWDSSLLGALGSRCPLTQGGRCSCHTDATRSIKCQTWRLCFELHPCSCRQIPSVDHVAAVRPRCYVKSKRHQTFTFMSSVLIQPEPNSPSQPQ